MSDPKRIVVVGGVAGGASAAARARRLSEDAKITVFERGRHISFANCGLPYHIGGTIQDRDALLIKTPEGFYNWFRVDVRVRHEVLEIDRRRNEIIAKNLDSGELVRQAYDSLVLSPGAEPVRLPVPGINGQRVFTLRNMNDMDTINRLLAEEQPESAVVVGGGYIGLEMVEALHQRGLKVTLVELADQVMTAADAEMVAPIHEDIVQRGIDLRLRTSAVEFIQNGNELNVRLSSGETVSCGLAVSAVGVRPEVSLAKAAGLKIGRLGGIVVDGHMRTSDENIYAVGDAVEVQNFVGGRESLIPLAGPAGRQGRIAADNIFGRESTYKATQGTAICKFFDQTIGVTGMSEKALKRDGIAYEKVYVHPQSHAAYYPGASPMCIKLLFGPDDGHILGAQAIGADGVDKRIDVLATALRAEMTVFDLEELELAYAPPYGSAKDPVNYAGFAAANVLRGDVKQCHVRDVLKMSEHQGLLDVRTDDERAASRIPGAVHILLDELRDRLDELSKDKQWIVFCQIGLRGYLACRILTQNGFKCLNLSGGVKTYLMATHASSHVGHGEANADRAAAITRIDAADAAATGPSRPKTSKKTPARRQ